jgi:hypothetical protein
MKSKKLPKKEIILKTDLSFEELIEGAFNDKTTLPKKQGSFKKRNGEPMSKTGNDLRDRNGNPIKK